jgi:hypothetical protein
METALAPVNGKAVISAQIEQVLVAGNLSTLTTDQRLSYYNAVCDSVGLNPLTRPFEYITLNGKLTLYARKDCTDQLRKVHGVSVVIAAREVVEDVYVVTARAADKTGRTDESIGAVPLKGLQGEARANAMMKAETKAKRRVTLSVCGLGILDENEVDSIPGAQVYTPPSPKSIAAYSATPTTAAATTSTPATTPAAHTVAAPTEPTATAATPEPRGTVDGEAEITEASGQTEDEDILDRVTVYEWDERGESWQQVRDEPRISKGQLAKIHVLRGRLGHHLDRITKDPNSGPGVSARKVNEKEGKLKQKLRETFGKESCGELSVREAGRTIDWLEAMAEKIYKRLDRGNEELPASKSWTADPKKNETANQLQGLMELTHVLVANGHKTTEARLAWIAQTLKRPINAATDLTVQEVGFALAVATGAVAP